MFWQFELIQNHSTTPLDAGESYPFQSDVLFNFFFFFLNEVLNEGKNYPTLYALIYPGWFVFTLFSSFLMSQFHINKEQPGLL